MDGEDFVLTMLLLAATATAGIEEGRAIYVAKCQACHGEHGRGDGPASRALPKPPRDFTSQAFWASTTDAQIKRVITVGLPGTIMRNFPMPEAQLEDLVAYLRSFGKAAARAG